MMWNGLKPQLKDLTGHIFDKEPDFMSLLRALRRVEGDLLQRKVKTKPATLMSAVTPEPQKDIDELKGMVKQLATDMASLKRQINKPTLPQATDFYGTSQRGQTRGYQRPMGEQRNSSQSRYDRWNAPHNGYPDSYDTRPVHPPDPMPPQATAPPRYRETTDTVEAPSDQDEDG
jgi:hypothetical protein